MSVERGAPVKSEGQQSQGGAGGLRGPAALKPSAAGPATRCKARGGAKPGAPKVRGVTAADGTTRAKIERAALTLFVEKGVDAATTREVAAAAGLSEGALYRHFASKEAIAETLFLAIHERLARLVREAGAAGETIEEQAGAVVDAWTKTADDDWTLFAFHLLATPHFLPTPPGSDNPVAAAEDLISAAMARGEIPEGDAMLVAAMALGVVLQAAQHKVYGRISGPLSAHAPAFRRGVVAVLRSL